MCMCSWCIFSASPRSAHTRRVRLSNVCVCSELSICLRVCVCAHIYPHTECAAGRACFSRCARARAWTKNQTTPAKTKKKKTQPEWSARTREAEASTTTTAFICLFHTRTRVRERTSTRIFVLAYLIRQFVQPESVPRPNALFVLVKSARWSLQKAISFSKHKFLLVEL